VGILGLASLLVVPCFNQLLSVMVSYGFEFC
jgi:hypothetical protein